MSSTVAGQPGRVYAISCGAGRRHVIYNASEIGNPPDHASDRWYFLLHPIGPGLEAGETFATAEAAERAARASDGQMAAEAPDV